MVVVVQAAAAVVVVTNYITASQASIEAFKTANLLKSLSVYALIVGQRGTGKLTLAKYIMPNASIIDASSYNEIVVALQSSNELIISHLDTISNLHNVLSLAETNGVRIIATCSDTYINDLLEDKFSVRLVIPPLSERKEDINALIEHFAVEAQEKLDSLHVIPSNFKPDISENAISLRRQVYMLSMLNNVSQEDIMDMLEKYLYEKLGSKNDYRDNLYLFEVPLINAGMKKFKSQLQLSEKLGLNRNTLRKKIAENRDLGLII